MEILSQDRSRIIVTETTTFFRRVFSWMTLGLLGSALSAYLTASSPTIISYLIGNKIFFFGLVILELILVVWISASVTRPTTSQRVGNLFIIYSLVNGVTLSVVLLAFTATSVGTTFVITAGMFGAMSLYGATTKRDITSWGSFLFMGLVGIILASVVNLFIKSGPLSMTISLLGVAIFVGLTAYDTQKLKQLAAHSRLDTEEGQKIALLGALTLYLDFINLFLHLLQFFGKRRD